MLKKIILGLLTLSPLSLSSIEFMKDYLDYSEEKPPPQVSNDLIYGDESSTEITTEINAYESIIANTPIHGSIFITHLSKNAIDSESFKIGKIPLKVTFVQSTTMSSDSDIVVSIYNFQLPGLPPGVHTLPPIYVKVAEKTAQSLPLIVEVFNSSN